MYSKVLDFASLQDMVCCDAIFADYIWGEAHTKAYFKNVLEIVNELAAPLYTCLRPPGAAGAILVTKRSDYILGVVEPASGKTCKELGACEIENNHCVRTVHAEVNAILVAAANGISTSGATMYSLLKPCYQCSKVIVAAGIKHIVYAGAAYDEERTRQLLESAQVRCTFIDIGLPYGN